MENVNPGSGETGRSATSTGGRDKDTAGRGEGRGGRGSAHTRRCYAMITQDASPTTQKETKVGDSLSTKLAWTPKYLTGGEDMEDLNHSYFGHRPQFTI